MQLRLLKVDRTAIRVSCRRARENDDSLGEDQRFTGRRGEHVGLRAVGKTGLVANEALRTACCDSRTNSDVASSNNLHKIMQLVCTVA